MTTDRSWRELTKPQVAYLTKLMRRDAPLQPYAGEWRTVDALAPAGFLKNCGDGCVRITEAGLRVLRDYRSVRYANGGSIAQLDDMQEVERALVASAGQ